MRALRKSFAVVIWPAIAWLGTACDQPIEPTKEPTQVGPSFAVGGPTCFVPGDYLTIQAAVSDPGCSTIIVAPGSYLEAVTIARPLTLLGPNATTPWNGTRGPEAFVTSPATTFNLLNGTDVTIAGFTITGDFGIYVSTSTSGTEILNNVITGTTRSLTLDGTGNNTDVLGNHLVSPVRSLHVSAGPYTNLQINENQFSGTGTIFFGANIPITGFEFNDNNVLEYANIASDIVNGTVSGNTFDAPPSAVLDLQILLQNSTMTDNVFEGDDASACLQLYGTQFSPGDPSHDVTISDNRFSDCGMATPPWNFAIQLSNDVYNINIRNNDISDGYEGVNTRDVPPPWDVTRNIHINFNNITNNTNFGVRNGQLGILDAECNWWGSADGPGPVGPGSGDKVSTNVDYRPWLTSPAPGGACVGGLPPGKVTGGGQITVGVSGKGTFGFNASQDDDGVAKGHLNYMNHVTDVHLNCRVTLITELTPTDAEFEGTCSSKTYTGDFEAVVEDNGKSGKTDEFRISYGAIVLEGGVLRSGNIQIHQ